MMKTTFVLLIFLMALLQVSCSMPVKETEQGYVPPKWWRNKLHNVVSIARENVGQERGIYLVDIPLLEKADSCYTFFLETPIPLQSFKDVDGFFPSIDEFILIVPDWEFYDRVARDATAQGITLEPATTNYYYHFQRKDNKVYVDSVHVMGEGHPEMNFRSLTSVKGMLQVYWTERYGSRCCPRDPRWDIVALDPDFLKRYQLVNNVQISGTYIQHLGLEGEHSTYYTLDGLTTAQRIRFIVAKQHQWRVGHVQRHRQDSVSLFTPRLIPREDKTRQHLKLLKD